MNATIVYQPLLLSNMQKICQHFGVSRKRVRDWISAGAPIAVEGAGKKTFYSAELMELQAWRKNRFAGMTCLDSDSDNG